jgi:hypothetical protein
VVERADRRLEQALADLTAALEATGVPWMVIGGIALIARGVRRFTTDIDAAVRGDEVAIPSLLAKLARRRIVPRIGDAERFAKQNLVLLLEHAPSGVELDVSLAWTEFEHEAIASAKVASFGAVKAPMARPEDLIVFKAIAGRGKDIEDATALLVLYPKLDLARIRDRVRQLADLADAPELAVGLEAVIARVVPGKAHPSAIKLRRAHPSASTTKPRATSRARASATKRSDAGKATPAKRYKKK